MELHEVLKFIHILAATVWVGGVIILNALIARANSRPDRHAVVRLTAEVEWAGPWLISPFAVIVIGVGLWLVYLEDEWVLSQLWVVLSLILVGVSMIQGMGYFGPEGKRITRLVDERGAEDVEVRRRMGRLLWLARFDVLLLLVVLWLMVLKPGA